MKRASPPTDLDITDGTRPVGRLIPRSGAYEAFTADGLYVCKGATVAEARSALLRADREHRQALARLEDDGAPAA